MRGSPVSRSHGKSPSMRPAPSWNGPVWWNRGGQCELSKSNSRGHCVIQASFEIVADGLSQSTSEADALCICPCDRDGWRKRFEEALYTFSVPGQSCRTSFMRPVIETEWCIARVIEVQRVSDVGIWHTKAHRRQLSVDQNGVEYGRIDRGCS